MTDLEATRLCAIAIDIGSYECPGNKPEHTIRLNGSSSPGNEYWPLARDDQTMDLIRKFDMVIEREKDNTFGVSLFHGTYKSGLPVEVVRNEPNLNRAVVYAVAAMQLRKQEE